MVEPVIRDWVALRPSPVETHPRLLLGLLLEATSEHVSFSGGHGERPSRRAGSRYGSGPRRSRRSSDVVEENHDPGAVQEDLGDVQEVLFELLSGPDPARARFGPDPAPPTRAIATTEGR